MDVQGDYEPMDAGGFIKINALRSRIIVLFMNNLLEICIFHMIYLLKKIVYVTHYTHTFFSGFKSIVDFDRNSSERVFDGAY